MRVLTFDPLPGRQPYASDRIMRVRQSQSGLRLIEFLCEHHPPTPRNNWRQWLAVGDISLDGLPVDANKVVNAGERYLHRMHDVVEPDVRHTIAIVHEDDCLIVVDKPAPLPVHPSGRFNRNTLISFLQYEFPNQVLRLAHRLDANTSGIVVLTTTSQAAAHVQSQFMTHNVSKEYLARVHGDCPWDQYCCELPIGDAAQHAGFQNTLGARVVHPEGLQAETRFEVLSRGNDATTLIKAIPITGRTNQIRVHLWAMGFPIIGDPLYFEEQKLGRQQTLRVDDAPMRLHAQRISFRHPQSDEPVTFDSQCRAWS